MPFETFVQVGARWPPMLKIAKPIKSTFSPGPHGILAEILYEALVGPWF